MMHIWSAVLVLFVLFTDLSAQTSGDFFTGPSATSNEPMFFSIYSVFPQQRGNANMAKIAAGGFTDAGPYFGSEVNPLSNPAEFYNRIGEANAHNLGFIAHIPKPPDVIDDTAGFIRGDSMEAISERDLRSYIRRVMDATLDDAIANDTVSAWLILPEELRPWRDAEMDYLQTVVGEIKRYDPLNRPVSMYNPNHRTSDQLETVVNQGLDWAMMGLYATPVPFETRGARIVDGVERIITAAENTETDPVAVFQLSVDYDSAEIQSLAEALGSVSEEEAIKQVIRHDVYQGLVRGISGVQIWSGCDCRNGLTTYNAQLDGYLSVSQDINGEQKLADVFLQGEFREDFETTLLSGPTTVTYENTVIDSLSLADIAYDGARYLFMVNSSDSNLEVGVSGLPFDISTQMEDLFNIAGGLTILDGESFTLSLDPLDVVALRITPVPEPSSLVLAIVATTGIALFCGFGRFDSR